MAAWLVQLESYTEAFKIKHVNTKGSTAVKQLFQYIGITTQVNHDKKKGEYNK